MTYITDDLRIQSLQPVTAPVEILSEIPLSERAAQTTFEARSAISNILNGSDDRLLVITGPCSIHDPAVAREYAERLQPLIEKYRDDLVIVMRVYFEKPRTTVGWKGLINDPNLDDSFEINKGLRLARKLLLELNDMGVPAGTEYLDLITPQYVTDLISWGAIGARTTESQVHRELASGLSCPVGFKNGTDGTIKIAVDAIGAASKPHHFLSVTKDGTSAIFATSGNPDCHIILRGGNGAPNYDAASIDQAGKELEKAGLPARIMVDFSHANSQKKHERQLSVAEDIATQLRNGEHRIMGVMIESNLVAGRQDLKPGEPLVYGQSITDACIGWDETVPVLKQLADATRARREALADVKKPATA